MKRSKRILALVLAMLFVVTAFAGCGNNAANNGSGDAKATATPAPTQAPGATATPTPTPIPEPVALDVMVPFGSNEHDGEEYTEMMYNTIDEHCNTDITWTFYQENAYWESLTLVMASNDMPDIFVVNKDTAGWLTAVKYGAFYELSQYLGKGDYRNLDTIPEAVIQNASVDGYLYGIPRSRNLYRNGWGYRQDWVNNLGIADPTTLEEFYDMLVAFTNQDPDGNGLNDTYGLGLCDFYGPLDMLQCMWGAPNGWGIDKNGDLIPAHLTEEYIACLTEVRKWYSEGLINPDYDEFSSGNWDSQLLRNNVAGCTADVVDRFRRNQESMDDTNPNVLHMTIPGVDIDGDGVIYLMPTAGYSGMIVINKAGVSEDELPGALNFLDKMNDAEMCNLIQYGVLDKTYTVDENGYGVFLTAEEQTALGVPQYNWRDGFNQIIPYFHCAEEAEKILSTEAASPARQLEANHKAGIWPETFADYKIEFTVNYGAAYTSETQANIGAELDAIVIDARNAYIKGEIDLTGWEAEIDRWKQSGGQTVIDEMNAKYHAAGH